jgi:hypothetical protein
MATAPDPLDVIEAMAAYEDAVGDLYAAFAVKFRQDDDLWHQLSAEERGHGEALRSLAGEAEELSIFLDTDRFNAAEVRAATRRLKERAEVVAYSSVGLREALAEAVEIERSMVDSQVFQVFQTDTPSVVAVLDHLREQTDVHRRRLTEELQRVDRRG